MNTAGGEDTRCAPYIAKLKRMENSFLASTLREVKEVFFNELLILTFTRTSILYEEEP